VLSDERMGAFSQVLNLSQPSGSRTVRHRLHVRYLRDRELEAPGRLAAPRREQLLRRQARAAALRRPLGGAAGTLTAGTTVWKGVQERAAHRAGLERIDSYSSEQGFSIYKDHQYELISVYDNPGQERADAMAVEERLACPRPDHSGLLALGSAPGRSLP
jgi:hypothetical protein